MSEAMAWTYTEHRGAGIAAGRIARARWRRQVARSKRCVSKQPIGPYCVCLRATALMIAASARAPAQSGN